MIVIAGIFFKAKAAPQKLAMAIAAYPDSSEGLELGQCLSKEFTNIKTLFQLKLF